MSWTDTEGKTGTVLTVHSLLERHFQRLLLQQLDWPRFDTLVFVEPRIEGSTEGKKYDKTVENDRAKTVIPGPPD